MEKSHYSGKVWRHMAKAQYIVNTNGLIIHNARHSPGCVHGVRVYRMKHSTFPSGLPSRDGGEKRRKVRIYVDRGYPGVQEMYKDVEVVAAIRRKPGKNFSDAEKAFNKLHPKIRVYVEHAIRWVKTWRIMGDRYRNPLRKYDRINSIVCGLVNQRVLWLAERAT